MKIFINLMVSLSIIGMVSTLICGLWMRKQANVDVSSINFHIGIGTFSVIIVIITIIVLMINR